MALKNELLLWAQHNNKKKLKSMMVMMTRKRKSAHILQVLEADKNIKTDTLVLAQCALPADFPGS